MFDDMDFLPVLLPFVAAVACLATYLVFRAFTIIDSLERRVSLLESKHPDVEIPYSIYGEGEEGETLNQKPK